MRSISEKSAASAPYACARKQPIFENEENMEGFAGFLAPLGFQGGKGLPGLFWPILTPSAAPLTPSHRPPAGGRSCFAGLFRFAFCTLLAPAQGRMRLVMLAWVTDLIRSRRERSFPFPFATSLSPFTTGSPHLNLADVILSSGFKWFGGGGLHIRGLTCSLCFEDPMNSRNSRVRRACLHLQVPVHLLPLCGGKNCVVQTITATSPVAVVV